MPAWGLDPAVYAPVEERCRTGVGDDEFNQLTTRGDGMNHDELVNLAGTGATTPAHAAG